MSEPSWFTVEYVFNDAADPPHTGAQTVYANDSEGAWNKVTFGDPPNMRLPVCIRKATPDEEDAVRYTPVHQYNGEKWVLIGYRDCITGLLMEKVEV